MPGAQHLHPCFTFLSQKNCSAPKALEREKGQRVQVFLTENYLGIAMEYANGGDSFEYVRKKGGLHENEARWFFQQLIVALDYCHRKGVINRDVKLENTLIHWARKPLLKICDFGYSKDMKYQSAPASRVGTPACLARRVAPVQRWASLPSGLTPCAPRIPCVPCYSRVSGVAPTVTLHASEGRPMCGWQRAATAASSRHNVSEGLASECR